MDLLTSSSAGRRFPSYRANRTHSRRRHRSCGYSFRHSSWWCKQHNADMAWCHQLRDREWMFTGFKVCVCMCLCACMRRQLTCSSALLTIAEGGWADGPQAQALRSLLPCCITGLVGMPQLLTVVTELSTTALPAARDLRTAGTAEGYHCISSRGQTNHINTHTHYFIKCFSTFFRYSVVCFQFSKEQDPLKGDLRFKSTKALLHLHWHQTFCSRYSEQLSPSLTPCSDLV